MLSTGFSWADNNIEKQHASRNALSISKKRKQYEDDMKVHKPTSNSKRTFAVASSLYSSSASSASSSSSSSSSSSLPPLVTSKFKKVKTQKILGQKLPLNRLIEVLDHSELQKLVQNLIQEHPEVSESVSRLAPKPQLNDSLKVIKSKFDNIMNHVPYKCNIESDYSYLRIKPFLNEFFNCLSDFILHYLPPIEHSLFTSLKFLDEITELIHLIPNFSNNEFQYTKLMAYDQVVSCWMVVLTGEENPALSQSNASGSPVSIKTLTNDESIKVFHELQLQSKAEHHNERTNGKFEPVKLFIQLEIENYELVNQHLSGNSISDLISVDYSNYSLSARLN